ncbi:MAG: BRCT domain-containing protein, partial [Phycisphaerae bacterium]|nr:BRCT domain-containing protein [Phycisphaerae bacterium]
EIATRFCGMTGASTVLDIEKLVREKRSQNCEPDCLKKEMPEQRDDSEFSVTYGPGEESEGLDIFIGQPYAVRHDVRGTSIVLTGEFAGLPRKDAIELLQEEGAVVKSSVSRKTDVLVVADKLWHAWQRNGHSTGKLRRALDLRHEGYRIQILAASDIFRIWDR